MLWSSSVILCLAVLQLDARALHAKGHGGPTGLGPEKKCLEQLGMEMEEVLPYVHIETSVEDTEGIGEFLLCTWEARGIMDEGGNVHADKIAEYFEDIYYEYGLTEEDKKTIRLAVQPCEQEHGQKPTTTAILAKNCMVRAAKTLNFQH